MPILGPRYDVLDIRFADGKPAVLLHTDGSGFAYYPSGRKAICVSAHGLDGQGRARRFGVLVHDDTPRNAIVAVFDEWGQGSADGMISHGDTQLPKFLVSEKAITVIDGSGKATEVPRLLASQRSGSSPTGRAGATTLAMRLNASVTLRHQSGRTMIEFQCDGVSHTFIVGEMNGEEVAGMSLATSPKPLGGESGKQLNEATQRLDEVREKVSTLKVDSSRRDAKSTFVLNTSSIKDVLDSLNTLNLSLTRPGLAPHDLKWDTEMRLKQLLSEVHPQCPGQDNKKWTIARVSGRCTEERLANAKPTVATPKSLPQVSILKLPELIQETSSSNTLLVIICLAAYVRDQSNYARLLAEKAHAELWQRFCTQPESGPLPVKLVAVELTELGGFADQYGVKEVPHCLMYLGGSQVYSKRLHGIRSAPREAAAARPKVLLVEPAPAQQLKLERNLRRNGYTSDLALDGNQAIRLAARPEGYGVLLASSKLSAEQLRAASAAVKRTQPNAVILAFDAGLASDEAAEERQRFLDQCSYVFPFAPSYTGLAAVLSRFEVTSVEKGLAAVPVTSHKQDFLSDILGMLDKKGVTTKTS